MAKRKLTDTLVRNLKPAPKGKRAEYSDTHTPGFCVRVTDKGVKTYALYTRWPPTGTPARRAIGNSAKISLAAARKIAREWLSQIERGIDPREQERRERAKEVRDRACTFGAVAEAYIAEHLKNKRRGRVDAREIRRELLPQWAKRPVTEITRSDVIALVKPLAARAPATAHLVLGHTKRIYAWAIEQDAYGIEMSPAILVRPQKLIGKKQVRTRVLNDAELRALWLASDKVGYPYGAVFKLIALTGVRLNEAAGARWREFDLERRLWTIPSERFKSEQEHRLPLSEDAVELLQSLPRFGCDLLFTFGSVAVNSFSTGKKLLDTQMREELGGELSPYVIHDLRRTVRTRLSALRIPETVAEMVLGHARKGLLRVYDQHEYETEMREALSAWAARLHSIVHPSPPSRKVVSLAGRSR